jgi:S1-C subfamily serine protease
MKIRDRIRWIRNGRRITVWTGPPNTEKRMRHAIYLIALTVIAAAPAAAAETAFNPAVLHSVVTVLPERKPVAHRTPDTDQGIEEISGSGVVIRSNGFIATNYHVLADARLVSVRLADGRELPAEIVGRDVTTDIALLKVEEDLPPLPLGPEPAVGAPVCTVSDPFGVGLTVTCGVASAVHRSGMGFNAIEDFIQTDAVLNPGSSGGALLDGQGGLVGLVAAIFTRSADANIGINFAISAPLLSRVVDDILAHRSVVLPDPGWRLIPLAGPERLDYAGLRVAELKSGWDAANAGFAVGDVITAIGGRPVRKRSEAVAALFLQPPGQPIEIAVVRDGKPATRSLSLSN